MAGELLFRVMNRAAAKQYVEGEVANIDQLFADGGKWSLTRPFFGTGYVLLDGSAFFEEAPWLYEDQDELEPLFADEEEQGEAQTLVIPSELVRNWRKRLSQLPADGQVARDLPAVRDALIQLMDGVIADEGLALTVENLL